MAKKIWSVETKNQSYVDDEFNGTYAQCVKYAKGLIKDGDCAPEDLQIAHIQLDKNGCVDYCLDLVKGTNL